MVNAGPEAGRFPQADMAVGLYAAGCHQPSAGINDLCAFGAGDIRAYCSDLSVIADEHTAILQIRTGHGFHMCVFDQ